MSDTELESTPRFGVWTQWTLRGLVELDGSATPLELEKHVAKQLAETLAPGQIARILKNKYLRWASYELRKAGFLGGVYGTWELTAAGRALGEAHLSLDFAPAALRVAVSRSATC